MDGLSTQIIANPGCFPTAILLSLHPLLESDLINKDTIIIDAKTGVSGAGRTLSQNVHFGEANENFSAYKLDPISIHQKLNSIYHKSRNQT